jgi:Ca2+-binding EF-hand superfamily protein
MPRKLLLITACFLIVRPCFADNQDSAKKTNDKQVPPFVTLLLQGGVDNFIKRFDKDKDGMLSKDEVPPGLARIFDRFDKNSDGKLDKQEMQALLQVMRQRFGDSNKKPEANPNKNPATNNAQIEKVVDRLLQQMDTDKDGRISRAEAKDRIAQFFDQLDTNKDGYLDKEELRKAAARFLANQGGQGRPGPGNLPRGPEFDDLDKNADGRLTPDELKGTTFGEHFEEIDTNKDGKIDRKEFQTYLKKQSEKESEKPADNSTTAKKPEKK